MADPRAPRLPSKVSEHGDPAAWRPTWPDQTRRRPVGVLPQLQWRKAAFRPGTDSFQHRLQNDDKAGKWRPWGWGWRVCQVPPGRQPIQYTALSSSHQDSWEAYQGPSLPWLPTQKVPKVILYGELSTRHRDRGAPKKRYQVCLKKSLIVCHIDCQQWSDKAVDRDAWRHTVHKAASLFEENRRDSLKDKRQRRKAQAASTTENPDLTYMCRHCTRTCLSRIGLLSHERACSRRGQQPSWSSFAKSSQTKHDSDFSSKRSMRYISLIWLLNSVLAALEWAKINRVIRDIHNFIILYCKNLHCIVYTCSSFQFFFSYSFFLFFFLVNVYLMISSTRLD